MLWSRIISKILHRYCSEEGAKWHFAFAVYLSNLNSVLNETYMGNRPIGNTVPVGNTRTTPSIPDTDHSLDPGSRIATRSKSGNFSSSFWRRYVGLLYRVISSRSLLCVLNVHLVQTFCAHSTAICRPNWTRIPWPCTCTNVTRWHSKNCSQSSLWQIVQSQPLRRY